MYSLLLLLTAAPLAHAADEPVPTARFSGAIPLNGIDTLTIDPPDMKDVATEDAARAAARAQEPGPFRFAIPYTVTAKTDARGTWEDLGDGRKMWRLRIKAPGAKSVNLGFSEYQMSKRGRLLIYSTDETLVVRPFTSSDNRSHGQLWTPVVESDDLIVELTVPENEMGSVKLELDSVNYGYRSFDDTATEKSGSCNVDVACPDSAGWDDQVRSVAAYTVSGFDACTGALVNNTAEDNKPYFLTAYHCGVNSGNAATVVTYWNYQNSTCRPPGSIASGGPGDGSRDQFVSGTIFRAAYAPSDFTLLELNASPNTFSPFYAGWNRGGPSPTFAVAIHHPRVEEKRISFEYNATTITSYGGTTSPGGGTHIHVSDWDVGTTEPGSSGSPLFDQNQRIVGQLHGGSAACGNDLSDWYGRVNVSWTGGGTNSTRLSNWLDPGSNGDTTLDGRDVDGGGSDNDDFADRVLLTGSAGRTTGSNVGATGELNEPNHTAANTAPLASVWWEWIAPTTGPVSFDTLNSNFDTTLSVYTGNVLGSQAEIAANDDTVGLLSRVTFNAQAGTSYKIAVDGYLTSEGNIVLTWYGPEEIGVYRPGVRRWLLDRNGSGNWSPGDALYAFGVPGDIAIAGDWNGDGFEEIGVYRPSNRRFFLDWNGNGAWNPGIDVRSEPFGNLGDIPIVGDWNDDGADEIGVYRPSGKKFFLDFNGSDSWNPGLDLVRGPFGASGDRPVIGDWRGVGRDEIGVYRPATRRFYLDNTGNGRWDPGQDQVTAAFGRLNDTPISGDWNADGVDEIGVFRGTTAQFFLDFNNNDVWNPGVDVVRQFGRSGDTAVNGQW